MLADAIAATVMACPSSSSIFTVPVTNIGLLPNDINILALA